MVSAEVQTRAEETDSLVKQVVAFKKEWETNLIDDRANLSVIMKDVHIAGQLLAGKITDYDMLNIQDMATTCGSPFPLGSTGGSTMPTATPSPVPTGAPASRPVTSP
mmetsp:Transcript_98281/g.204989  ORF Transcript_98281/g.204989 Transcript_98281/m.204989 type:complete len:107 (-) Transcript_98281:74-394(-)